MATNLTVRARIPLGSISKLITDLPSIINGRKPDKFRIRDAFWAAFTREWFILLHKSFSRKSDGQSDEFGQLWKPLAKSTIAQRKVGRAEKKAAGIKGKRTRGLLTPSQDKQWKGIFASTFRKLAPRIGEAAAKAEAGKLAWAIMKSRGAQTKLEVFGNRKVPIGIDTGEMEKSLKPGSVQGTRYRPPKGQVARMEGSRMVLGTNVEHAPRFHKVRRLWPNVNRLSIWSTRAVDAGTRAVAERLARVL